MTLGSTQPLTEMSTRNISWGKSGRCLGLTILPPSYAVVMKSGNLNFLEPSGPLQACNGTALPLPYPSSNIWKMLSGPSIICIFSCTLLCNPLRLLHCFQQHTTEIILWVSYLDSIWKSYNWNRAYLISRLVRRYKVIKLIMLWATYICEFNYPAYVRVY